MKRLFTFLIVVTMVFALCACGGKEAAKQVETTPPAEEAPIWSIRKTVDDFGDVTENSQTLITTQINGSFSDGEHIEEQDLEGTVFFQKTYGSHCAMGIGLRENGEIKPTITDKDEKQLLVKIDDKTYEFPLTAPNGTLYAGVERYSYDGDWLLNQLYNGTDLRCVIYVGKSKYSFNLDSGNLAQLMNDENLAPVPAEMSVKEALEIYLTDANWTNDKTGFTRAYNYFYNHIEDFPRMTTADLEREINGVYLETEVTQTTGGGYWVIRKYEDSMSQQLHWWASYDERLKADDISRDRSDNPSEFSVENDMLTRGIISSAQVRKIADGIYIRYIRGPQGDYRSPDYLMFAYNGPYKWRADIEAMSAELLRGVSAGMEEN